MLIKDIREAISGKRIGLDLETTGLDAITDTIIGISIAVEGGSDYWLPIGPPPFPYRQTMKELSEFLGKEPAEIVIQNAKFDVKFLKQAGIEIEVPLIDTMTASQLVDSDRFSHGLDSLSQEFLGEGKLDKYANVGSLFGPSMEEYAKKDARLHIRLYDEYLKAALHRVNQMNIFKDLEMPVLMSVVETELRGIRFDRVHIEKLKTSEIDKLIVVENKIHEMAGYKFDVSSTKQVSELLFNSLKLDKSVTRETKNPGVYVTDDMVLSKLIKSHKIVELIVKYRGIKKSLDSYIIPLLTEHIRHDGRVYADFLPLGAHARFSCRNPNLQSFDKDIYGPRRAILPDEGCLIIQADYSQIELRIAAYVTKDPVMYTAIKNGKDLHSESAKMWSVDRQLAKMANFGLIFGMSAKKFYDNTKAEYPEIKLDLETAKILRKNFFETYTSFNQYYDKVHADLRKQEYVTTIFGRRRYFKGYKDIAYICREMDVERERIVDGKIETYIEHIGCGQTYSMHNRVDRCTNLIPDKNGVMTYCKNRVGVNWDGTAVNFPIQGSAADLLKIAYRNINRELVKKRKENPIWNRVHVMSLVHDELLVNAPIEIAVEARKFVSHVMETSVNLGIPIVAESMLATNWGECKEKAWKRLRNYIKSNMEPELIRIIFSYQKDKFKEKLNKLLTKRYAVR